jgi:dCTP deaminase
MSIITKNKILEKVSAGEISFSPSLDKFQVQAHAVDLRLGYTFLVPKSWHLTPKGREVLDITHFGKDDTALFDIVELEQGQFFDLAPGEYILVSTLESVKMPGDLMAVLYSRSSINRKGLSLDLTGTINAGYEGQLTLPIRNNTHAQTVRLYPGERICQIVFEELDSKLEVESGHRVKADIIESSTKTESEETKMIISGDIKKLKSDFKI